MVENNTLALSLSALTLSLSGSIFGMVSVMVRCFDRDVGVLPVGDRWGSVVVAIAMSLKRVSRGQPLYCQ